MVRVVVTDKLVLFSPAGFEASAPSALPLAVRCTFSLTVKGKEEQLTKFDWPFYSIRMKSILTTICHLKFLRITVKFSLSSSVGDKE